MLASRARFAAGVVSFAHSLAADRPRYITSPIKQYRYDAYICIDLSHAGNGRTRRQRLRGRLRRMSRYASAEYYRRQQAARRCRHATPASLRGLLRQAISGIEEPRQRRRAENYTPLAHAGEAIGSLPSQMPAEAAEEPWSLLPAEMQRDIAAARCRRLAAFRRPRYIRSPPLGQ